MNEVLGKSVRNSALFMAWKADQEIAFGLTVLASKAFPRSTQRRLKELLRKTPLEMLGDSALHQCASLDPRAEKALELFLAKEASEMLRRLRMDLGVNHQLLAARALALLLRSQLGFERFVRWAARLSPAAPKDSTVPLHIWTSQLWDELFSRCQKRADLWAKLESTMADFNSSDATLRIEAICEWYEALNTLYQANVPAPLRRLGFALVNAQFCWPLQIASKTGAAAAGGDEAIGLVLPLFATLDLEEQRGGEGRVLAFARGKRLRPGDERSFHCFEGSALHWDERWLQAMRVGLLAGKKLWRSQTGRMENDGRRRSMLRAALCVDFSVAVDIVDGALGKDASLCLSDKSAEIYWAQVALGLLLPAGRVPLARATGTIVKRGNEDMALGEVEGLAAKLAYASRTGFLQRVILPRTEQKREAVKRALEDERIRDDLLESNWCVNARDAADAMQVAGWRRAIFLGTPEARARFSGLSHDLFEVDASGLSLDPTVPIPRGTTNAQRACRDNAIAALKGIDGLEPCGPSSVTMIDGHKIDEGRLGRWLAWADHRVRSTNNDGFAGPGLGIACIRTNRGETSMRFWAHLFDVLQVSPALRDQFQFGTIDSAREALTQVLNNFEANVAISAMPAPDLLVIIDDAGRVARRERDIYPADDERRSLRRFFLETDIASHLARDLLPRDDKRTAVLHSTRILIVRPVAPIIAPHRVRGKAWNLDQVALDACRVFRSGFSVHSARAVIAAACAKIALPIPTWEQLRNTLGRAVYEGRISYGRGQYFFTAAQARAGPVLDARFVLDGTVHLAAGLSFAPIIAGTLDQPSRRLNMNAHELREAIWHLHQAYAFLDSREKEDLARGYLSLLGFVLPVQDWDTVRFLSFDAMNYAAEGFELSKSLIHQELQHDSPTDAACLGLSISAATRALSSTEIQRSSEPPANAGSGRRVRQVEKAREAYEWVERIVAIQESRGVMTPSDRIRLYAKQAFFLRQLLRRANEFNWKVDGLWVDKCLKKSLDLSREVLWPAVLHAYGTASLKTTHVNFPFEHGWLLYEYEERAARPDAEMDIWRCAWCMCATDVHPSVESWVLALSAFPRMAHVHDYARLIELWDERIQDKQAFAARFRSWVMRATAPAEPHWRSVTYQRRVQRVELMRDRLAQAARIARKLAQEGGFKDLQRIAAIELADMVSRAEQATMARHRGPSQPQPQQRRINVRPALGKRQASGNRPAQRRASR